jgi:hypothetical protein
MAAVDDDDDFIADDEVPVFCQSGWISTMTCGPSTTCTVDGTAVPAAMLNLALETRAALLWRRCVKIDAN